MHVIATAGHVDHGKSTLIRMLTGMEPDRWAEERRRGMTIDLGFAWTGLPSGSTVAFVDVPGHERFVPNMLAGIGPVPAVMFVVAADEGWMPQSQEHLDALHALGVRHGLLVITRSDLMEPELARAEALEHLAGSSLGQVSAVCVSGMTGAGLDTLRAVLDELVAALPTPDPDADVRLWVDRAFTIRGAGTVVTGTLPAGRLRVRDELLLVPADRRVTVRGLQSLGRPVESVSGVARVAINLRGVPLAAVRRGDALLSPGAWLDTRVIDVRLTASLTELTSTKLTSTKLTSTKLTSTKLTSTKLTSTGLARTKLTSTLPRQAVLHAGAAAVPARVRPLGADTARLSLAAPLPLRIGDRALLRDPGRHRVLAGLVVLDVRPPALRRRGAAMIRAAELDTLDGTPDGAGELRRRGLIQRGELIAMGACPPPDAIEAGGWLVDRELLAQRSARLVRAVAAVSAANPLEPGMPLETARQVTDLPDIRLVELLLGAGLPGERLTIGEGRVYADQPGTRLPPRIARAVEGIRAELAEHPFAAPEAARLATLGLGVQELAAAVRAGALVKVADGIYLAPGAAEQAVSRLATLPSPFTLSQARQALGTTRRVAVPIMELLARRGITRKLPDGTHELR